MLVMALILQNFNMKLEDPTYEMTTEQVLTIKPKDAYVRATLRPGITAMNIQDRLYCAPNMSPTIRRVSEPRSPSIASARPDHPMTILYGSNTGTCQAMAQNLAFEAALRGFTASIAEMNSAVKRLPWDNRPVIIITPSYDGQPADNAGQFLEYLQDAKDVNAFARTRFAVFGCGHSDWTDTFQRIPTLVDSLLASHGATRLAERGLSDVAEHNTMSDFEQWMEESLWPALSGEASEPVRVEMEVELSTQERAARLQHRLQCAEVVETRLLTAPGEPEKHHIQFKLPPHMSYQTGDYLLVLPLNSEESVSRVLRRFNLPVGTNPRSRSGWIYVIHVTDKAVVGRHHHHPERRATHAAYRHTAVRLGDPPRLCRARPTSHTTSE